MGTSKTKGDTGEDLAANWLAQHHYHIVKRNLRSPTGEVDIIVYRNACVAFVEVKSWQSLNKSSLADSIHSRKRRNIINTARYFLQKYPEWKQFSSRFDVVFVGPAGQIDHYAGAFSESGFQ
jgi:putative endonuclease